MDNWDNKDFFSKSVPNLISNRTMKKLEKALDVEDQNGGMFNFFGDFYTNYLADNIFILILLIIFILFLVYQYFNKQKEPFRPTMNPATEIKLQNSYTNYVDDSIPTLVNNKKVYGQDVYLPNNTGQSYIPITNHIEDRDSFVGYDNPYKNSQDQAYPHPYSWDTNFNTSTESAIEFAAENNRLSLNGVEHNNKVSPQSYGGVYRKSNMSVYDMPFAE